MNKQLLPWIIIVLFVLLNSCNQRELESPKPIQLEPVQSEPTQSGPRTLQTCQEESQRLADDLLRDSRIREALRSINLLGTMGEKSPNEEGFWVFEELKFDGTHHSPRKFRVERWGTSGDTCSDNTCSITPDYELITRPYNANLKRYVSYSAVADRDENRLDPLVGFAHNHPLRGDNYRGPSIKDITEQQTEKLSVLALIVNDLGMKAFDCTCNVNCPKADPEDFDDLLEHWGPEWNEDPYPEPEPDRETHSHGEPHIITYDKKGYDFQAVGDYVLSRSTIPNDDFEVQVRYTSRVQGPTSQDRISVVGAVAMMLNGEHLEFYAALGGTVTVYVNGQELINFPAEFPEIAIRESSSFGGGFEVRTTDGKLIKIGGFGPRMAPLTPIISDVNVLVPGRYYDSLEGLSGNANDDFSDDFHIRGSETLIDPTTEQLYFGDSINDYFASPGGNTYRDSWSLFYGASQSLFTQGTDPFSRTYPRSFISLDDFNAQRVEEAQAACETAGVMDAWGLRSCTFDVTLTQDFGWIDVYQGLEFSSSSFIVTPSLRVADSGLPTTLSFSAFTTAGDQITDPNDLSWELHGPDLDTTDLSVSGTTAQFTTTGERGEYTLVVNLVSDPSQIATATVVVANPLVVHPTEAIVVVSESKDFEASIDDGLSVGWSTQFGSTVQNGLSVTYTAPLVPNADTLTAFVQGDSSKNFDVPITVINDKLTPSQAFLNPNGTQSFTWEGAETLPIIWTASSGIITPDGVYSAPNTNGSYIVTASLVQDNIVSVSATVQVEILPIDLVAVSADGIQGDGRSKNASMTADGRYVVFSSLATNLLPEGDTNNSSDIFLKNLTTGAIQLVSAAADGTPGNFSGFQSSPSVTPDGRYVVFRSRANNLVVGDINNVDDIFLKDVVTGAIQRVSVAADGTESDKLSDNSSISADGRYVAFSSVATNLVPIDINDGGLNSRDGEDIFLKDTITGDIQLISIAADGTQGNGQSHSPTISADGRYVVFPSSASTLVPGDTNDSGDIFLKDVTTGAIQRVSVAADGTQGNDASNLSSVSPNGRYVVFYSDASNFVIGDTNNRNDIFLKDVINGDIQLVSVAADGTQGDLDSSGYSSVSADGRFVAFESRARNLVLGDTNNVSDIFLKDMTTGDIQLVSMSVDHNIGNHNSRNPSILASGQYVVFESNASNLVIADANGTREDIFRVVNPFWTP